MSEPMTRLEYDLAVAGEPHSNGIGPSYEDYLAEFQESTTKLTPAEIAALSDAALNEYGAKLLGWKLKQVRHADGHLVTVVVDTARFAGYRSLPKWAQSIDAQQAPGGPEEIGRSRGWELEVLVRADNDNAAILTHGDFVADDGSPLEVYALPRRALEARLRCEAWALALQEGSDA